MKIGIAIQAREILTAAAEDNHFTLLDRVPLSETDSVSPEVIAHKIVPLLSGQNSNVCISLPACWGLADRARFSAVLQQRSLHTCCLIPEPIAVLSALRQKKDSPSLADELIYLSPAANGTVSFSFLSGLTFEQELLWEGSFCGDAKFFRKTANMLGYSYKGQWSAHLKICGFPACMTSVLSSAEQKEFLLFPINEETILQGLTLYQSAALEAVHTLHYRCHSRFYLAVGEEKPQVFPCIPPLIPLPWDDYSCLHFFDRNQRVSFSAQAEKSCTLYEKTMAAPDSSQSPLQPLYSFSLHEPIGLWLSSSDGQIEPVAFPENTPHFREK